MNVPTMEGITYAAEVDEQSKQRAPKSAPPSGSASKNAPPRSNNLGQSPIAPTSKMTRPGVPLKPILPANKASKKLPPTSAFVRAKANREKMLAKMNDYSAPAPEAIERKNEAQDRRDTEVAHPIVKDPPMGEGNQSSRTRSMTLGVRPAAPFDNGRRLLVSEDEGRNRVDYTEKCKQEYLQSFREAQDPDYYEDPRNPYLKEYFEDENGEDDKERGDH
ncbi:hypothetical protein BKA64DRAFT_636091 [Cadophora sp. MPI-SDFR-AT-0126]|nr:hypothetical protein BKA64DRAFT_636091 [Leotiomycetes sp. MPI-SDFR-AT-0126]